MLLNTTVGMDLWYVSNMLSNGETKPPALLAMEPKPEAVCLKQRQQLVQVMVLFWFMKMRIKSWYISRNLNRQQPSFLFQPRIFIYFLNLSLCLVFVFNLKGTLYSSNTHVTAGYTITDTDTHRLILGNTTHKVMQFNEHKVQLRTRAYACMQCLLKKAIKQVLSTYDNGTVPTLSHVLLPWNNLSPNLPKRCWKQLLDIYSTYWSGPVCEKTS